MALSINEIKVGVTILVDNEAYLVIDTHHVKPGKGSAFVRAKIRNLKNNAIHEKTFRGDEKIDAAFIEERNLQYQYYAADMYHFMDQDTFEEVTIHEETIGSKKNFLKDNMEITASFYKNLVLSINLPNFIQFAITHTEPGIKGDTAKSGNKPAQIETGATIQVPLFIDVGNIVKIDTRTGQYVERAG